MIVLGSYDDHGKVGRFSTPATLKLYKTIKDAADFPAPMGDDLVFIRQARLEKGPKPEEV